MYEDRENEFAANLSLAGDHSASKPSKPVKLKRADGSVHSEHDNESSAMSAFKNEKDNKGMKIVREDFSVHVPTIGLNLDPQQLDQYDAEKVYANECPFCSGTTTTTPPTKSTKRR
jgi:hypothetical protein